MSDLENLTEQGVKSKILVVDDDPLNILIIKDALNENEYELKICMSGAEALKAIKSFIPDVILLDIMMPVMDGYEVTKEIRKNYPDNFIKIILVSAKMNIKDRLEGYESGADDYMTKPYDDGELIAKINVFLKLKYTQDKLKESKERLEELNNSLEEKVKIRTNQLLEAEKLSSIGKYAAGIVHNLNNPLAAVIGYGQLLLTQMAIQQNPNCQSWVNKILQSGDIMKNIVASVLTKGKSESSLDEKLIDLNEVLETQIDILNANHFFKNEITLKKELTSIPKIKGVYVHFSQSLGNFINNSVDAMFDAPIKELTIRSYSEGEFIVIEIQDTGCGIPADILDKIYDPFFTTKPLNTSIDRPSGTGLGMASSKQMLDAYQCQIEINSTVGVGTCFKIKLPMNESNI